MNFRSLRVLVVAPFAFAACSREQIDAPEMLSCAESYTGHPDNDAYQSALDAYVSQSEAPGSIIGVKKLNQPEWIGASGKSNLEHGTEMLACTPFRTGSVTKVFTAVVVMQLVEEGALSLDTTIVEVLPELNDEIPQADTITVEQLLNHTSGLKQPTDDDLNYQLALINSPKRIGGLDSRSRLDKYIYGKPLKNSPGTDSYYSNAGYWVLQWMIEEITGESLQQNLQDRILSPLNLADTYLEKRTNSNVSRGYNFSGNKLKDVTIWDSADSDGDPSAGIISTGYDLLIFGEALFSGTLVSDSSLALMKTTTSFPSCGGDCGYGLGIETWITEENSGYGKNGSSVGVDANVIFFPDKGTTIVLFSNYGGGNRKDVIDDLLDI